MYDMQIASYDANLCFFFCFFLFFLFFMDKFKIYLIIQHKKLLSMCFFALNLKICSILQFTIRFYDSRSHLLSMILHRIPILTTLVVPLLFCFVFIFLFFYFLLLLFIKCFLIFNFFF